MENLDWQEIIPLILLGVTIILVITATFLMIFNIPNYDEEKSQKECYEIYATDKVILKKCEKYFE